MRIKCDLTRDSVLKAADEITIFAKYLNISEDDIITCIETGKLINSPIRYDDNDASVGFQYSNKGKLKMKDFSGYFWGDCFDLVAFVLLKNVNNKADFVYILKHIYDTVTADNKVQRHLSQETVKHLIEASNRKRVIDIETREWNTYDKAFWNTFYYKVKDPIAYTQSKNVYPVNQYWMDRNSQPNSKYRYQSNNPCYAYFFGYDDNGVANYRLYFPFQKAPYPKFITNNSSYQGLDDIKPDADGLLFIKSNKDRIAIDSFLCHIPDIKINVIAPPSENHIVSKQEFDWLMSHVKGTFKDSDKKAVLSIYDFDRTGLNGSGHLKRVFDVPRFMFTDGKYKTVLTGNKDFTDTIPMYGKEQMFKMIKNYLLKLI